MAQIVLSPLLIFIGYQWWIKHHATCITLLVTRSYLWLNRFQDGYTVKQKRKLFSIDKLLNRKITFLRLLSTCPLSIKIETSFIHPPPTCKSIHLNTSKNKKLSKSTYFVILQSTYKWFHSNKSKSRKLHLTLVGDRDSYVANYRKINN